MTDRHAEQNPWNRPQNLCGDGSVNLTDSLGSTCVKVEISSGVWMVSADVDLKYQVDAESAGTMGALPHWRWAKEWAELPAIPQGETRWLKMVRGGSTDGTYHVDRVTKR